ncbi:hypothetical protein LTR08_008344 [Meristemomyces frigidus]|nr:hypothetical protein LTR08_008344 [Meristemomyces frigidus]
MDTTSAPLVPFRPQIADIQLRRWNAASVKAWKQASDHHADSHHFVADAEWALDDARQRHARRQQQMRQNASVSDDEESGSEPDWANDAIVRGKQAVKIARLRRNVAAEAARQAKGVQLRADKMIKAFMKEFPQYQAVVTSKRKRSPTDGDDDNANANGNEEAPRPKKREPRRPTTFPPPRSSSHNHADEQARRQAQSADWRKAAQTAFARRTAMTAFPLPPVWPCTNATCQQQDKSERALQACGCNIRFALRGLGVKALKRERHEWHPDRFEQCGKVAVEMRRLWQKMATEVFTAISGMLSEN